MTDTTLDWQWIATRLTVMKEICLALQEDYFTYALDVVREYEDLERRFRRGERTQELFAAISRWGYE